MKSTLTTDNAEQIRKFITNHPTLELLMEMQTLVSATLDKDNSDISAENELELIELRDAIRKEISHRLDCYL